MEWKAVESSQISEVGYDAESSTLGIRFKAGKRGKSGQQVSEHDFVSEYHYQNVKPEMYQSLLNAESVGKYFGEFIKPFPAKYPFTKIEPTAV